MSHEPTTDDVEDVEEIPDEFLDEDVDESQIARTPAEYTNAHPIVDLLGDSARVLLLVTLYTAPEPLNPTRITEWAGVSAHTWYDHKDALLESGLVVQTGNAGNSPLYALREDDERIKALDILSYATVEHQLDQLEADDVGE